MNELQQITNQIARLTANCLTQTMDEEFRRMARLQQLHAKFTELGGDQSTLDNAIGREMRASETASEW